MTKTAQTVRLSSIIRIYLRALSKHPVLLTFTIIGMAGLQYTQLAIPLYIRTILDTLGWIEHLRGNNGEAAKLLRRASQLAANRAEVRLHAAIVLADSGAAAEARGHLDAAIALDPSLETRDDVKQLRERIRK